MKTRRMSGVDVLSLVFGLAIAAASPVAALAQDATSSTVDTTPPGTSPPAGDAGSVPPQSSQEPADSYTSDSYSDYDIITLRPAERRKRRHHFGLGVGLQTGVTYWTETSPVGTDKAIGKALSLGWNLGFRATFDFLSWLALDGRIITTQNDANSIVHNGSMRTFGGMGLVRFTLPIRHIQPYAVGGIGGYRLFGSGANSELLTSSVWAYQGGLGAIVPVGHNFEFGLEWMYAHLNGEVLSTNPEADGGDPNTFSLFAQYHFPL